ncbi:Rtt106-domain-containing protein [Aulographum hederae CBS 113979]|uniref:Rtt106-domain-containing protein n=1 Tax=Aulographum hederae CBS 113979 TaxID=1176131 RepID=A0A6G1GQ19_9PEZI|nr:Rtt106-domain-containing protein [Aulographum hederae CBS 113979]
MDDLDLLDQAIPDRPDLLNGLRKISLSKDAESAALVKNLANYIIDLRERIPTSFAPNGIQLTGPRKRRFEESANGADTPGWADAATKAVFSVPDVSFSIPQRKKLRLEWVAADKKDVDKGGIRAVDANGKVEFGVSWKDIDQIFCLPVPEKTKRAWNFVAIPTDGNGITADTPETASEPVVWTYQELTAKEKEAAGNPEPEPERTTNLLDKELSTIGKHVVLPDEKEFVSAVVQSHRKNEKAVHVKAHKGSKEGYLFFLPPGILFAFKKPLLFFPFSAISSISYTSVLQRTFNLNISTQSTGSSDDKAQEIEFSMLDQADFPSIDAYVKKHGLNDASLAEGRRAKKYEVNKVKTEEGAAAEPTEGEDGETELQKAERELQDQEDEEEEDFDPGSEGDSDGSGSSDEEDEYEYGDGAMGDVQGEDDEEEVEEEEEEEEVEPEVVQPPPKKKAKMEVRQKKEAEYSGYNDDDYL